MLLRNQAIHFVSAYIFYSTITNQDELRFTSCWNLIQEAYVKIKESIFDFELIVSKDCNCWDILLGRN